MNKTSVNKDFLNVLRGERINGIDRRWNLLARLIRNALLQQKNQQGISFQKNHLAMKEQIRKKLEDNFLIPKKKKTFDYKTWFLVLVIGSSGAYATKEYIHFTKPLPLELTFSQEELEGQDPKLFWTKWFHNGTFVMFGHKSVSKPVPTNVTECDELSHCLTILENNPYNPNLLFNIGLIYESGKYENVEKALEFYKRSMALGNFYAQYNYENLIKKQKK